MRFVIPHPRLFASPDRPSDDVDGPDGNESVAALSVIGQTPIEELVHPVLLTLEGENRGLYELEELVKVLALGGTWPLHNPLPEGFAHLPALRARDASDLARPQSSVHAPRGDPLDPPEPASTFLRHLEFGFGPLTRKRFSSADLAPVRLVGAPASGLTEAERLRLQGETLNLLLHRVVLDGLVARAAAFMDMRADPSFRPPMALGETADPALAVAVRSNDLPMVKALLLARAAPNALKTREWIARSTSGPQRTPLLMLAATVDPSGALLGELLRAGADPNVTDDEGRCALALPSISLECVKLLHTQRNASVDPRPDGEAPLVVACRGGRLPIVRYLVYEMGADVDAARPLHAAVQGGFAEIVALLIAENADVMATDAEERGVMHYAVAGHRGLGVMRPLADAVASKPALRGQLLDGPNEAGRTPLHVAVRLNHRRSVEALLALGASPRERDLHDSERAPLHVAAALDHVDIARLLVEKDAALMAAIDAQQRTPLHVALYASAEDTFALLLDHGARPTFAMLSFAARHSMWPYLLRMVRAGVTLWSTDSTALHELVGSAAFLPKAFAPPSDETVKGLLDAIFEREPALLRRGAYAGGTEKRTALQFAYGHRHVRGAHALLRHFLPRLSLAEKQAALTYEPHADGRTLLHDLASMHDDTGLHLLAAHAAPWLAEHLDDRERRFGATPLCLALAALCGPQGHAQARRFAQHDGLRLPLPYLDASETELLARAPSLQCVKTLLARGASQTLADAAGYAPLHYWLFSAAIVERSPDVLDRDFARDVVGLLQTHMLQAVPGVRAPEAMDSLLPRIDEARVVEAYRAHAEVTALAARYGRKRALAEEDP